MGTIAILDSGVGGLSVYQEIVKKCPDHRFVFVSDNQAFPYGTKTEQQLNERVTSLVARIVEQYKPDILVVACNTASTVILPLLRARYDFPIVGVVPAIKPAAALSSTHTIGLLATPGTISRSYTDRLIEEFASDHTVIKLGSSLLVELAEAKLRGKTVDLALLEHELSSFITNDKMDVVVLACTHFPLLKSELENLFKSKSKKITFVDSGAAIASRVSALSNENAIESSKHSGIAVFTCNNNSTQFRQYLTSIGFNSFDVINV